MRFDTVRVSSITISEQPFALGPDFDVEGLDTIKFVVTLEPDEDGFIVASCPALPGCHSQGRTREEALANIEEAIRGYIASMRDHGEPIPVEEVEEVEVLV